MENYLLLLEEQKRVREFFLLLLLLVILVKNNMPLWSTLGQPSLSSDLSSFMHVVAHVRILFLLVAG